MEIERGRSQAIGIIRAMGFGRADAEDLAQESVIRAYERRAQLRGDPVRWLLAIARNAGRDRSKYNSIRPVWVSTEVLGEIAGGDDPCEAAIRGEAARLVRAAVESLPEHQRPIVTALYLEERSVAEVAELLGIPEATVKTRAWRARQALRRKLAWMMEVEG